MARTFASCLALVVALATTSAAFADPDSSDGDSVVEEQAPDLEAIAEKHQAAMAARAERLQRKLPSAEGQIAPEAFSVAPAGSFELLYATHPKALE